MERRSFTPLGLVSSSPVKSSETADLALGMARALGPLTLPTLPADAEARPFDVLPDNRFITATIPPDQAGPGVCRRRRN